MHKTQIEKTKEQLARTMGITDGGYHYEGKNFRDGFVKVDAPHMRTGMAMAR